MKKCDYAFLSCLYLTQVMLLAASLSESAAALYGIFAAVLGSLIFGAICIFFTFFSLRADVIMGLQKKMIALKLITIPFYLINFAIWGILGMAMLVVPGMFLGLPIVLIGTAYSYFCLLVTSANSIAFINFKYRNAQISRRKAILHCVLQLIFVIDVIDCIYLYHINKKENIP